MNADLSKIRFLVIDDMLTMRKFVVQQLRQMGATLITESPDAADAWQALQAAAKNDYPFQFIVSDWNMPKMKGIDLLKLCRKDAVYKDVAFLLVTAEAEVAQVKEALTAGVDNYIVKPFNSASFQDKITTVYRKRLSTLKAA